MKRATKIYEEYAAAMYLFARQITGNRADAEDALQNGFVRAFSGKSKPPENLVPWIYRAIRWAALDIVRARKRRGDLDERLLHETETVSLFDFSSLQAEDPELEHHLALLSDDYREIISLKIWSNMTFKEIAIALEIPANTAASRYRYALAALRKSMEQEVSHD